MTVEEGVALRMTEWENGCSGWQNLARVISSEARDLRSVNCEWCMYNEFRFLTVFGMTGEMTGGAFRMTGKGCCVRNGRMGGLFGMTGIGMLRSEWQNLARVVSSEGRI